MLREETNALCFDCHSRFAEQNKECKRTAKYFHTAITTLEREAGNLNERIAHLEESGLDTDPIASTVQQLHDILRRARSRIHAFDASEFAPVEEEGQLTLQAGWKLVAEAEAEYRFRRNGLVVSLGIMAFLAVLLWLKIREIDARE
jgi:hypothetical protein